MENATRARLTLGFRDRPGLRGSGDEKLTACGTHAAQGIPVDGSSGAPAGALRSVKGFVQISLLNANILPIDVQFFRNEHRERSLDALADFGILGRDGNQTVGMDVNKGHGRKGLVWSRRRLGQGTRNRIDVIAQQETAGSGGRNSKEGTTVEQIGIHRLPRPSTSPYCSAAQASRGKGRKSQSRCSAKSQAGQLRPQLGVWTYAEM